MSFANIRCSHNVVSEALQNPVRRSNALRVKLTRAFRMILESLIKSLSKLQRRRMLWTVAIYKTDALADIWRLSDLEPFHFIGETGLRIDRGYKATVADPFLYAATDRLFVFYEVQTDFGRGEIHAQAMDAGGNFIDLGVVLREQFHLSYPQVFDMAGDIWMIPEACESGKVWLYRATEFPTKWLRVRVLIDEPLVDTSLIVLDDCMYLIGTNRRNELKVFVGDSLQSEFIWNGVVITSDRAISRNGGRPILIDGDHYRFAQNCARKYGENVSVFRVKELSPDRYSEEEFIPDLFPKKPAWMALGHHHLSEASFCGVHFFAVDGMRPDRFMNNVSLALLKSLSWT